MNETKRCTKCGEEKPATGEYFSPDKRRSDGLKSWCKECKNRQQRERYANDPEHGERVRLRQRDRYANDPQYREYKNQQQKERYANDPEFRERHRQLEKEHRANNPEYYERKKQQDSQKLSERRANDPEFRERVLQKQKERLVNDPEFHEQEKQRQRQQKKEHYANDPEYRERVLQQSKAARHKRRAAEGVYTVADVELQYRSQNGQCWHCGKKLNGTYHIDHLIPLDKGGTNWPNNIVCACSKCNLSKGAKYTYEWNGRLF